VVAMGGGSNGSRRSGRRMSASYHDNWLTFPLPSIRG